MAPMSVKSQALHFTYTFYLSEVDVITPGEFQGVSTSDEVVHLQVDHIASVDVTNDLVTVIAREYAT